MTAYQGGVGSSSSHGFNTIIAILCATAFVSLLCCANIDPMAKVRLHQTSQKVFRSIPRSTYFSQPALQ